MYEWPYSCSAVTADALKIMTAPSRHSPNVTTNNHRSFSSLLGMSFPRICRIRVQTPVLACCQTADQFLEDAPPLLVILELIEAGASRRQQHHVARMRGTECGVHRAFQSPASSDRHASLDLLLDLVRRSANQKRQNRLFAQRISQLCVIAVFVFAPEYHQNAARKRIERFQGGVDVGSLRIVVIAHPLNLGHKLNAMFDTLERP